MMRTPGAEEKPKDKMYFGWVLKLKLYSIKPVTIFSGPRWQFLP
jgi:hypothetical protein